MFSLFSGIKFSVFNFITKAFSCLLIPKFNAILSFGITFLMLVGALVSSTPVTALSQASLQQVSSQSYQASIETKRAKDLSDIKARVELEGKQEVDKRRLELAISGSCSDRVGWIEDTGVTGKSLNATSYFVPRNRTIPSTYNPVANPSSYVVISCNSTDKVNYLDTATSKFQVINNKIEKKDIKLEGSDYAYTNTANDFKAYFGTNPNMGWLFKSQDTTVKVSAVGLKVEEKGGAKVIPLGINTPILKDNTITYPEILPNIDLQYIVTNRGVNKFFVLKSAEALKNNLKEISYTLDAGTDVKVIEEVKEVKQAKEQKEKTYTPLRDGFEKSTSLRATPLEKGNLESGKPEIKLNDNKTNVKELEIRDKKGVGTVKINKPVTFDSKPVVESLEPAKVTTPTTTPAKLKADNPILENNFSLSPDSKTITIQLDQEYKDYLGSKDRVYPIMIDPETVSSGPMADTWVNSNTPDSIRTSEFSNRAHLVVGGSANIVGGYVAKARTWLKFGIPNNVERGSSVVSAQVWVRQYDGNSMKMEIKTACNFDEWSLTWNNQPCIAEKRAEIWSENFWCGTVGCGKWLGSSDIGALVRDNLNNNQREIRLQLNDDAESSMLYRKAVFCSGDGRTDNHPCKAGTGQAPVLQIIYDNWKNYAPANPNIFAPGKNSQHYLGCNKSDTGFDTATNTQITKQDGKCNQDKIGYGIGFNNVNDGNNGDRDEPYLTADVGNLQNGWFLNLANRERVNNNQDAWKWFNTYSGVFGARGYVGDRYGVNSQWAGGSERLDNQMAIIDKSAPVQVSPQVVLPSNSSAVDYVNGVINSNPPSPLDKGGKVDVSNQNGITYLGRNPLDPNNTNLQVTAPAPQYSDDLLSRVRIKNKENSAVLDIGGGNLNNGTSISMWRNNPWMQATGFVMDGNRFRTALTNNNTNYCLDSFGGASINTPIHLWECHQGYNQDWFFDTVTSQIKMLSRQDLCWEQARTYDDTAPVAIILQNCSSAGTASNPTTVKLTQQFILENMEEVRLKLKDTDRTMQHNGNDGNQGSTMKMSYDGLDWQKFYYSNLTREIRNHSGQHCLTSPNTPNQQVAILDCANSSNPDSATRKVNPDQQWTFENGVVKSSLPNSNICLGVLGNKWQNDIQVMGVTCNPNDGNQQIYKESVFKRYFPTLGMQTQSSIVRLTTNNGTTQVNPNDSANWSMLPLQTSPSIQYSNNPSSANPKDKILNQEDVFGITTKGLDRITGDGNQLNQSYWSNIAKFRLDIDKPVVKETSIVQVGNSLNITTTVADRNLALVQIELIQNKDGLRTTIAKESGCRLNPPSPLYQASVEKLLTPTTQEGTSTSTPCNITKTQFLQQDSKLGFNVDLGTTLSSGIYEIQVRAYDRAGNVSDDQATNNLVEIDRDPAKIAITYPVNKAWVSTSSTTLQGSVAGYNYGVTGNASLERNRDVEKLTIENVTPSPLNPPSPLYQGGSVNVPIQGNKNWTTAVNLQPGNNQFKLETTDKAGNKSNWIGDTSTISAETTNNKQGKQAKWEVNLDTSSPRIDKVEVYQRDATTNINTLVPAPSASDPSPSISSSNPNFVIQLSDPLMKTSDTTDIPTTSSGLNIGLNPKGYYLSLIKEEVENGKIINREIPLYYSDTVVSDPNPSPRLASNLDCSKSAGSPTVPITANPIACRISLANLVNGKYSLSVKVLDRAGNSSLVSSAASWSVNSFQQGSVNLDILPRTAVQPNLLVTPIDKATTTKGYTIINGVSTPYSKNLICVNSPELRSQNLIRLANNPGSSLSTNPSYGKGLDCDLTVKAAANMIGQVASGLVLPIAGSNYEVSIVRISDSDGLMTSTRSNLSTISYSTPDSFGGLEVTTSLDGLNTASEVQEVLNGTKNINSLKKTTIKVTVPKGTEALDVDYGDLTNLNILPNTQITTSDQGVNGITGTNGGSYGSPSNGMLNFNYNRIAVVNDLVETTAVLNPTKDATIKQNQFQKTTTAQLATSNSPAVPAVTVKNGNDLSRKELFNPCNQESCTWTVNYYLPYYQSGGKYDIRIRMYKGESITEASRSIEINGIIPTTPTLLRADKGVLSNQCRYQRSVATTLPTTTPTPPINQTANNTTTSPIACLEYNAIGNSSIIAGDSLNPPSPLYQASVEKLLTPTTQGGTSSIPTIYSNSDRNKLIIGADKDTSLFIQVTKPDKSIEYLTRRTNNVGVLYLDYLPLLDGAYQFALVRNNDGIYTPSFRLIRDTISPTLTSTKTTNLSNPDSTNPWARTGDNILFNITTNEPIATGAVVGENGYRSPVVKTLTVNPTNPTNSTTTQTTTQTNCTNFTPIDLLAGTLVGGLTNNSSTPAIPASCHNDYLNSLDSTTSLTITRGEEGLYTPTILLTDIAGNSSLITAGSNPAQTQINNQKSIAGSTIQRTINNTAFFDYNDLYYASPIILDTETPTIKATLPTNYPYSTTPRSNSLDFRLYLDNTTPTSLDWDIKPYQDNKDGVNADGLLPEADRITGRINNTINSNNTINTSNPLTTANTLFTTRSSTNNTPLYPRLEKGLRIQLDNNSYNSKNKTQFLPNGESKQVRTVTTQTNYTNCTPTRTVNKVGQGSIITQNGEDCTLAIDLLPILDTNQPSFGASDNGTPSTRTNLNYTVVDLAGNKSDLSTTLQTAIDKDKPLTSQEATSRNTAENRTNTTSGLVGGSQILEVKEVETGSVLASDITNKTILDTKVVGERNSDLVANLRQRTNPNPNNPSSPTTNNYPYGTSQMDDSWNGGTRFWLGDTKRDDDSSLAANCTTTSSSPIKNRRLGLCSDGVYTMAHSLVDTAGNSGSVMEKTVERDTVSPGAAVLSLSKVGNRVTGEKLSIGISGEARTKANFRLTSSQSKEWYYESYLDAFGNYNSSNPVGTLLCGGFKYTITATLTDKAGNVSTPATQAITTAECLVCTTSGNLSILTVPLRQNVSAGDRFTANTIGVFGNYAGYQELHAGQDYNQYRGAPIYAAASGTVVRVNGGFPNDGYENNPAGYANSVYIKHSLNIPNSNGVGATLTEVYTLYAHLQSNIPVSVGSVVTTSTIIGYMGNSGNSTGVHLHFQIETKGRILNTRGINFPGKFASYGTPDDANYYFGVTTGNSQTPAEQLACAGSGLGNTSPNPTNNQAITDSIYYDKEEDWNNTAKLTVVLNSDGSYNSTRDNSPKPIITNIDYSNPDELTVFGKSINNSNTANITILKKTPIKKDVCETRWVFDWFGSSNKEFCTKVETIQELEVDKFNTKLDTVKLFIDKQNPGGVREWDKGVKTLTNDPAETYLDPITNTSLNTAINNRYSINIKNQNITKDSSICPKTKTPTSISRQDQAGNWIPYTLPGTTTSLNLTDGQNEIWGDCVGVGDYVKSLESTITVNSNQSSTEGKLKDQTDNATTIDRNNRKVNLKFISDSDRANYQNSYKDNRQVWVISHGWNDTRDSFETIVKNIKAKNPNDIVMTLDWSEASFNEHSQCKAGALIINCPKGVNWAASWINPTATQVAKKLKSWGMTDGNKLNLVGHSLGSILSGELSNQFQSKAKLLIALDPPSEELNSPQGIYKVAINPEQSRSTFDQYAQFSRSIVGKRSLAGNQVLAKTANETFWFDNGYDTDTGEQHSQVVTTFGGIIGDNKIKDTDFLSTLPFNFRVKDGLKGTLTTDMNDTNRVNYLEYLAQDNQTKYFGTVQNNRIPLSGNALEGLDIYGDGGNDELVTNIIPYENIVVKDLTQGDKIVLGNGDSRAYTLVTVGNLVKIKLNGKEVCGVEIGSVSESDLRTDLEKLKLNFNDPAIKYFIKKQ